MNDKVVSALTAKALAQIEKGVLPWRKPWTLGTWPHNMVSGKGYSGFNVINLAFSAMCDGWTHGWATFKQISNAGGKIRKGEKASRISYWKFFEGKDGKEFPMIRYFSVFNLSQLEDQGSLKLVEVEPSEIEPIEMAEQMVAKYEGPRINHDQHGRAYYSPGHDIVHMTVREEHVNTEEYYGTLFHELVHSTGHESRLARINRPMAFGSEIYSKEELVAEIGSIIMCSMCDVTPDLDNSASYIAGWCRKLKDEPALLLTAAGAAQKAVNHITGVNRDQNPS
jgi:antirestriction protein ArdC